MEIHFFRHSSLLSAQDFFCWFGVFPPLALLWPLHSTANSALSTIRCVQSSSRVMVHSTFSKLPGLLTWVISMVWQNTVQEVPSVVMQPRVLSNVEHSNGGRSPCCLGLHSECLFSDISVWHRVSWIHSHPLLGGMCTYSIVGLVSVTACSLQQRLLALSVPVSSKPWLGVSFGEMLFERFPEYWLFHYT